MPTVANTRRAPSTVRAARVSTVDMSKAKIESVITDPKEADKERKSLLGGEQAPTAAEMTPDAATAQANRATLGPPFDVERITLAQCRQIRKDPMVAFGLHFMKVPLVRAEWHIDARDRNGVNPQIAAFVDASLRQIYARLIFQRTLSYDFGYQGIVKRLIFQNPGGLYADPKDPDQALKAAWDEGNVLPVIWKSPVALRPEQVTPKFDERTGEFAGMLYDVPPAQRNRASGFKSQSSKGNQAQREIDIYHAYWGVNQKDQEHGSMYGYPRVAFARDYWWAYRFLYGLSNRAYERLAIPSLVAHYPPGVTPMGDGTSRNNWELAIEAAERLRSNGIAAVPSSMATTAGLDSSSSMREWEFTFMETPYEALTIFDNRFNYLNVMKLRSVWVPELAFMGNGTGGNSAGNIAEHMSEMMVQSLAIDMDEIDDEINRLWIPQLLAINFPDFINNGGVCKKVSHGFRTEDMENYRQVIQLIGQSRPEDIAKVDLLEIFRRLNTPIKSGEALAAERERTAAAQALQGAPLVEPTRNGVGVIANPNANPGVTNGGSSPKPNSNGDALVGFESPTIYVAGPEHIELSEIDNFVSSLPDSKHYKDKTIRSLMLQLRRLWLGHYRNLFPEFASHVATTKMSLSEVDLEQGEFAEIDADSLALMFANDRSTDRVRVVSKANAIKAANAMMRKWSVSSKKLDELREKSGKLIKSIVERTIELERKENNLEPNISTDTLNEWLTEQTGRLIKLTNQSIKNELRDFLAKEIRGGSTTEEIADNIRAHFTGFEGSKADRVARSEVRDAVNAATLMTGEASGIRYTRAEDGEEYDERCRKRNGKLFTVKEAWKEIRKVHPNDTLAFKLIPRANFSIEFVPSMPDNCPFEDAGMWFDNEGDTAYILSENIANDTVDEFLDHLGAALVS